MQLREPTVFYDLVVEEACELTSEPTLSRQRRIPQLVDDGAPNHHFSSAEEYFRQQYSCNDKIPIISTNFKCLYSNSLDISRLKVQLPLLTEVLKQEILNTTSGLKQ